VADRAWALNDENDLDGAIRESDLALKLDDQCVKALLCRANALIKRRAFEPAIADLEKAASLDPQNHRPEVELSWAYNQLSDADNAIAHADRAIQLKFDSGEAHYQRGAAHRQKRMYRDAVADFAAAIQHQPDLVWAYRDRAVVYQELGEPARARMDELKADEIEAKRKP